MKNIIGLIFLLATSINVCAQGSSDSPATIALAKKLGLAKISECLYGLSLTMTTYESMKNSTVETERDSYKGLEAFRLSYGILGSSYGTEKFQASVKKTISSIEGKPSSEVIKSTAQNCIGNEIIQYTRARNGM